MKVDAGSLDYISNSKNTGFRASVESWVHVKDSSFPHTSEGICWKKSSILQMTNSAEALAKGFGISFQGWGYGAFRSWLDGYSRISRLEIISYKRIRGSLSSHNKEYGISRYTAGEAYKI